MRALVFFVLLLTCASSAALDKSRTLGRDGIVGVWQSAPQAGLFSWIKRMYREEPHDTLEIRHDRSVKLVRRFEDGGTQVLAASPAQVSFHDDLMIVSFERPPLTARLVVTGWHSAHSKRLFGQLFLYDQNGLFNGMAVTFEQVLPH